MSVEQQCWPSVSEQAKELLVFDASTNSSVEAAQTSPPPLERNNSRGHEVLAEGLQNLGFYPGGENLVLESGSSSGVATVEASTDTTMNTSMDTDNFPSTLDHPLSLHSHLLSAASVLTSLGSRTGSCG